MKIVNLNVRRYSNRINDKYTVKWGVRVPADSVRKPYAYMSARTFYLGANKQVAHPGIAITECCKKHNLSYKRFYEIASMEAKTYGFSFSYQSILNYAHGYCCPKLDILKAVAMAIDKIDKAENGFRQAMGYSKLRGRIGKAA